jgi:ketosteroid isomerase-like protein
MKTSIAVLLVALSLSAPSSGAPPSSASAEDEIMAGMEAWRQAMMKKDRAAFERLYHSDLTYGHSNGQLETKPEAIQHIVAGKSDYASVDLADTKIKVHGNFALVTGRVNLKQVTDGKPSDVRLIVLHVWTRGPQGWQMIGRQSTREPAQ